MPCAYPILLHDTRNNLIKVRCGYCPDCLLHRGREWTCRLLAEHLVSGKNSTFITLTYDDLNLPSDGVSKRSIQLFNKSMRNFVDYRYYFVGEYGGEFGRPHYHAVLFGLDFTDCPLFSNIVPNAKSGFNVNCDYWRKGFVHCETLTPNLASYICGYVNSKIDIEKRRVMEAGRNPTFNLMSLRPALGVPYFDKNYKKIIDDGYIKFFGQTFFLPRYFINKYMTPCEKTQYVIKCIKSNIECDAELLKNVGVDISSQVIYRNEVRLQANRNIMSNFKRRK